MRVIIAKEKNYDKVRPLHGESFAPLSLSLSLPLFLVALRRFLCPLLPVARAHDGEWGGSFSPATSARSPLCAFAVKLPRLVLLL